MVLVDLEGLVGCGGGGSDFSFFLICFFSVIIFLLYLILLCGIHVSVRVSAYLPHVLKLTVLNLLSNERVKLHNIFFFG